MRFWIYFKGSNNGELLVGYRYAIGDNIENLIVPNYQSCETNATQCSWQRIEIPLTAVLNDSTEILIGVRTGADRDAIMALDDITYTPQCVIYNGTTPTRPPTTTPYTGPPTTTTKYVGPSTTTTPYTGPPTTTTTSITPITPTNPPVTTSTQGKTTTTDIVCAQYTCQNDGICKPSTTEIGKPSCECKPGFTGERCENKESGKSNLGAILGGVFGGLALIALLVVGYIFILPKIRSTSGSTTAATSLLASVPTSITNPLFDKDTTSDA